LATVDTVTHSGVTYLLQRSADTVLSTSIIIGQGHNMPRLRYLYFVLTLLEIGLCGVSSYAQISQASLQGIVKDTSGATVPGATVTLKNKGTDQSRSAVTGTSGEYTIPNLDPAEYSLTASLKGFKTVVISSLTLHTGEHSTVNATMEVGAASQEVTVEAMVPLLNTASAEVNHLVLPSQVVELPLNGRNFWELTQLTPGATFVPRGQTALFNGSEIRVRDSVATLIKSQISKYLLENICFHQYSFATEIYKVRNGPTQNKDERRP
jgi:hypothetical protein